MLSGNVFIKYASIGMVIFLIGCHKEQIETYITKNAIAIDSMDITSNEYADLLPIGKAIGEARIVMLGEQDHGDAAAFLAKTRLIKYLHEKKGFTVLAFESDFFGLTEGWEKALKNKEDIAAFARKNIFKIWTLCDACQYLLYDYIPKSFSSGKPLKLAGFDSQMVLDYSERNLARAVDSIVTAYHLPVAKTEAYQEFIKTDLNNLLAQYEKRKEGQSFYWTMGKVLAEIEVQLAAKVDTADYWLLVVKNLVQFNKQLAAKNFNVANSERDKQMALNLQWLLKYKLQNEKVIVWAHNAHIMKNTDHLSDSKYRYVNMATHFLNRSNFNDQTYVLGFTSGKGVAGRIGMSTYSIPSGETKSVDGILLKLTYPFAFLDFNTFNRDYPMENKPFLMKGSGHGYGRERWNTVYNGVFYIKDMYPCRPR